MTLLVHPKEPALFWLNLHTNQKTSMFFAFGQNMVVREQLDSAHLFCRYFLSQYQYNWKSTLVTCKISKLAWTMASLLRL